MRWLTRRPDRSNSNSACGPACAPRSATLQVTGLDATREEFIASLRPWKDGERVTPARMDEFRGRLAETGLFATTAVRLARRRRPAQTAPPRAMSSSNSPSASAAPSPSAPPPPPATASASMREWELRNWSGWGDTRHRHRPARHAGAPHRRDLSPAPHRQVWPHPRARRRDRGFRNRRVRPVRRQRLRHAGRTALPARARIARRRSGLRQHPRRRRRAPTAPAAAMSTSSPARARRNMSACATSSIR